MQSGPLNSGGVRRSSLISLSDLDDEDIATCKSDPNWWQSKPHLACANNSAVFEGRPSEAEFWINWQLLADSKSGERGLFNRQAARNRAMKFGRRLYENIAFGTNPCGEISLRPYAMCNLSEAAIYWFDTPETIMEKVEMAAIFGTLQARLTRFNEDILRSDWRLNGEDEALLGVSLTGIMDNAFMSTPSKELADFLVALRKKVVAVNAEWAKKLGIRPSTAATTVKPSGTVSQLCGTASGIHPRWAPHYERRVQIDANDPALAFVRGELPELAVETSSYNKSHSVMVFPLAAPPGARGFATYVDSPSYKIKPSTVNSIAQLRLVKFYNKYFCEHNVSASIYVDDTPDAWRTVGRWVWNHFDDIAGLSFFPRDMGNYPQAPFIAITPEKYELSAKVLREAEAKLDWAKMSYYENKANGALDSINRENISCAGGACEIVRP